MSRRRSGLLVLVALIGLLGMAIPVFAADSSVTITEVDERYAFSPATVYVNVGDSVTWTNDSDAPHTVDSDSGGELESGNFNEGETFDHSFSATGSFAYHCDIHDYMKGTVVVLAEGVTPPPTEAAPAQPAPTTTPDGLLLLLLVLGATSGAALALRRVPVRR